MPHPKWLRCLWRARRSTVLRLVVLIASAATSLYVARQRAKLTHPTSVADLPGELVLSPFADTRIQQVSLRSIPAAQHPGEESVGDSEGRREEGGGPGKRLDWFAEQRAYPLDRLPRAARLKAYQQMKSMERLQASAVQETWVNIGPAPMRDSIIGQHQVDVSGRVTALAIDPRDPRVVYLGAALGGVWKSSDDGASWIPLTDNQPSLAVGALALDLNNPDVIYVGTGEPHAALDSYYGAGVLKSMDSGTTWQQLGASEFAGLGISAIIVHPHNSNTVYVASSAAVGPDGPYTPSQGVFKSTDGGHTWSGLRVCSSCYGASDLLMDTADPSILYAAFWQEGIFRSTDAGQSWQQLANGLPAQDYARIELAIAPSNPSVLYAGFDLDIAGRYRGAKVFKTTDGGDTWQELTSAPNYCGGQCWYDNVIAVHPYNPNIIYLGGSANYISVPRWSVREVVVRSTDGGLTWWDLSPNDTPAHTLHPDVHAIAFDPQNPQNVWVGNDGGVWKSSDSGLTWSNRNSNLATLQFIGVAVHPTDPQTVFGGMQDNNKAKYTGSTAWEAMDAGDGGYAVIDPFDPRYYYGTRYGISFQRNDRGGTKAYGDWPVKTSGINLNDRALFYAPFAVDPSTPGVLYLGTHRVYRTTNRGDRWQVISGDLTRGAPRAGISTVAVAPTARETLYVGTSDGQIHVTTNTGGQWNNATKAPLPNRFVSEIVVSYTSHRTAYAVFNGFNTHTPPTPGHVFRTTDGGASWMDISSNLPDIPVLCISLDRDAPGTLFVGTDVGVFRSTDDGAAWSPFSTGMANVAVFDLTLNPDTEVLAAATHGRSVYRMHLAGEPTPTPTTTPTNTASPTATATHTAEPGASLTPSATVRPPSAQVYLPIVLRGFEGPGPAVTPTATVEPTPAYPFPPSPLTYFDDFGDSTSGWNEAVDPVCVTGYVDGEYEIHTSGPCAQWAPTTHSPAGMVKVTARLSGSTPGVYGLVFGGRDEPQELLVMWIDPVAQQYALQKLAGGTWSELISWSFSASIRVASQANHLAIRQDGQQVHLYVNGEHLQSLADETAAQNTLVGISHWARYGGQTAARFDDFATTTPTVAYEDDFSDSDSGWYEDTEGICQSAYENEEFRATTAADWACLHPAPSYPLPNGRVQVRARRGDSLYPTAYGLALAGNAYSNFSRFYALWLSPDSQQFSLFRFDAGWQMLVPWTWSSEINPGAIANDIAVVRDGARVDIYINNAYQTTIEDRSLLENGYFGLLNWAFPHAPGAAYFDDLQVTIWDVVPGQFAAPSGSDRGRALRFPPPTELPPQ